MVTGEARRLKEQHPTAKILIGDEAREVWSPLYENNPYISRLSEVQPGDEVLWVKSAAGKRPYLEPGKPTQGRFYFVPFQPVAGNIFFTDEELRFAELTTAGLGPFAVIEPHIKGNVSARNKDWGWENYQAVADIVSSEVKLVQLGPPDCPALEGVARVVTPNLRMAAAILARARFYLGPEGGMHHAAAALGVPAVVIFGSYVSPANTGYANQQNLYSDLPGSPCGNRRPCGHCLKGMSLISIATVVESVVKATNWQGAGADLAKERALRKRWKKNRLVAREVRRERMRRIWERLKSFFSSVSPVVVV